jgi:hypothetical protein
MTKRNGRRDALAKSASSLLTCGMCVLQVGNGGVLDMVCCAAYVKPARSGVVMPSSHHASSRLLAIWVGVMVGTNALGASFGGAIDEV